MNQVPWLNDIGRNFTSAFSGSGASGSAGALIATQVPASGFSFNVATGQDASGNIQTAGGLADANWTVTNADNYKQAPIAFTTAPGNVDWFTGGGGNPGWFANGPSSSWICADPDNAANGAMTFTLTFNLTGYNPADAMLVGGQVAADDNATVTLNGHSLGNTGSGAGWTAFHTLSNGAGDFVAGVNTLVIQIGSTDNFLEAVRLEGAIVDTVASGPPGPVHWANAVSADFNTAADWTGGIVPGPTNGALLDAAGSTPYTVTASTTETVLNVQTAATATLVISGGTFTVANGTGNGANAGTIQIINGAILAAGGSVANSGTIVVGGIAGGALTTWSVGGATTLSGAGKVTLSDQLGNQIAGGASAATLTNVNNTISGAGTIGSSTLTFVNESAGIIDATGVNGLILNTGSNAITNAGLIEATGAGGLAIDSAVANTGTLTALGAGALTLQNASVTNTGGAVRAGVGGHVSLKGETIAGGAVTVAAGGLLSADGGTSVLTPATFTNAGTASVGNGASLAVGGAITNSGTIAVASTGTGAATSLAITGATTLSGAGKVTLSDQPYNQIIGGASAATLTNVNNAISGAGTIGSSTLTLINESAGIIGATGVNGLVLNTGSNAIVNAGLIEATGAGGLTIESAVANAGGVISVGAGSHIDLLGADVMGGTLETATGRAIRIKAGAASVLDGTASAINDQALIIVARQAALTIEGSITNTKGIRLVGATAHSPTLTIGAAGVTLSGGGHIAMDNSAGNLITGASSAATLTNVDNFIGGAGRLGGGQLALVNEAMGVIAGNQATALIIDTGANTIVNAGVIVTRGAGGMTITSAVANSGRLEAVGSVMTLDGAVSGSGVATITGGAIDFASAFSENVAFRGGTGVLGLAQSQSYGGIINGFSATGGTALDLGDIAFVSAGEATFSGKFSGGVLTVSDGTHTASLSLRGNFLRTTFTASSDGHGGTMVTATSAPAAAAPAHRFVAAMAALAAPGGAAVHLGDVAAFHPATLARPHVMAA